MILEKYERVFNPHPISGILKTEQRYLKMENEQLLQVNNRPVLFEGNHPRFWIGKREPIYAAPNEPLMAWAFITDIVHEDVRYISPEGADREGYHLTYAFMNNWTYQYDRDIWKGFPEHDLNMPSKALEGLFKRPKARYQAWVIRYVLDLRSVRIKHTRMKGWDMYQFNLAFHRSYPVEDDPMEILGYFFSASVFDSDMEDEIDVPRKAYSPR